MKKILLPSLLSLFIVGCLVPLPDGSGVQISLDRVPVEEMPEVVPPQRDQAEGTVSGLEAIVMGAFNPLAGALLYQFVFRPLRRRREKKKEQA